MGPLRRPCAALFLAGTLHRDKTSIDPSMRSLKLMALTQKSLSYRGRRHASPGTQEHKEDKAIAAQRKAVTWVPLVNENDDATDDKRLPNPLGDGGQYKVIEGKLSACSAEEFVAHLDRIQETRNWYTGTMKRGNKDTKVRRKRPDVIEQIGVTLAPWQTEFLRFTAGMDNGKYRHDVEHCYAEIAEAITRKYTEITEREVVGVTPHLETSNDHFHLQGTRVDANNQLIGKHRGLRTGGGWLAGVKRQIDSGGVPDDSEKARVFNRNLAAFKERNEGELPLDIALNNVADEVFDRLFGKTAFAKLCMENYALNVREMEAVAMERQANELEQRALVIREEIALREPEITSVAPPMPTPHRGTECPPTLPGLF